MKEPAIATPHQLFGQSARYRAPVFQRLYVWSEPQLKAMLEDIDSDSCQFLGAIVLQDLGKQKGPTSPNSYLIIDGQQRLTTLYILLAVLADIASNCGADDVAAYVRNEYLAESKSPSFEGQPKLVPTLQDRSSLWALLEQSHTALSWDFAAEPGADGKSKSALGAQWHRARSELWDLLIDEDGELVREELDRILERIQSGLTFICITLEATDDANEIFRKLNAQGIALALADLVRNEVFGKFQAGEAKKAEKFYDSKWHSFERSFGGPKELNAYFPIYSYVVSKGKVTKASAFPSLQVKWKAAAPQKILTDLNVYAPFYRALVDGKAVPGLGKNVSGMAARFSRMPRTTVTWPYLIQVMHAAATGGCEESAAVACLETVESFLVRRALVGIEPTGLHAVFKSLWHSVGTDPEHLVGKITTRTIHCPDDDEISKYLLSQAVYSRVITPFVLGELERHYRKCNKYDVITETVATVEHIMPKARGAWPNVADAKQHDALVDLIGNLVPLSEAQNKGLKDQAWDAKRLRYKGSNFQVTQKVAKVKVWNAAAIQSRTKEVLSWVLERWPAVAKD